MKRFNDRESETRRYGDGSTRSAHADGSIGPANADGSTGPAYADDGGATARDDGAVVSHNQLTAIVDVNATDADATADDAAASWKFAGCA